MINNKMVNYHKLPVFSVNMYSKSDLVLCGKLGSKFGKLGGRPITKGQLGMPDYCFQFQYMYTTAERQIIAKNLLKIPGMRGFFFCNEIPNKIL